MAFDTTRLVNQITLKGCLPTGRFTTAELMDLAYDVLISEMVPLMIDVREEYYVRDDDTAITANKATYPITSRAFGGTLRELKLVQSDGTIVDLTRIDPEDFNTVRTGTPENFFVQGNDIVLDPTPSVTSGTLRQKFFIRPSSFVSTSDCAQITAINTLTNTVTLTTPASWSTTNTFDLVKGRAHFDIISYDLAASSVAAGSIQFSSALPSTLTVGDWVCLAEQSCFPYLPIEGHVALIQAVAAAAQESIGLPQSEQTAAKAKMLKENFKTVLSVRIQGAPKRLGVRII